MVSDFLSQMEAEAILAESAGERVVSAWIRAIAQAAHIRALQTIGEAGTRPALGIPAAKPQAEQASEHSERSAANQLCEECKDQEGKEVP